MVTHKKESKTISLWDFVSIVSHQLRNPLASTKLSVEMLLEEELGPLTDEQKSYLKMILDDNQHMIRLVKEFLTVSGIEQGDIQLETKPVDLIKVTDEAIRELTPFASAHNITMAMAQRDGGVSNVRTDPLKIREVITNILDNAIKYNRGGGTVQVEIEHMQDGKSVVWRSEDTGIGIPEQEKQMIFTKLFRATNAGRIHPEGTGIGLYIAKAIIEKSGGEIGFESHEGKGSTFWFRLPIANGH